MPLLIRLEIDMRQPVILMALLLLCFGMIAGSENEPPPPVVEEPICTIDISALAHKIPSVSPDCARVAFVERTNNKMRAVIDGKAGDLFDEVYRPRFSANSRRCGYVARNWQKHLVVVEGVKSKEYDAIVPASLLLSPDNKGIAFIAVQDANYFVIRDEAAFGPYLSVSEIAFSPDGSKLAWCAEITQGESALFVDGKRKHKGAAGNICFSPDGKRMAFIAYFAPGRDEAKKPNTVMIDGKKGEETTSRRSEMVFSPDSNRFAYTITKEDGKSSMVIDGKIEAFDLVRSPVFSGNSKRFGFAARQGDKEFVVVEKSRSKSHDRVSEPYFSPDGSRMAYIAQMTNMEAVFENGKMHGEYHDVIEPVFSPDGKNLTYLARFMENAFFVLNGAEVRRFTVPYASSLRYSPKGSRFAYVLHCKDGNCVIVENVELASYDEVLAPERHITVERFSSENSRKTEKPDALIFENMDDKLVFESENRLRLIARRGNSLIRVTITR